jgi:hypothetical protein
MRARWKPENGPAKSESGLIGWSGCFVKILPMEEPQMRRVRILRLKLLVLLRISARRFVVG